MPGNERTVQRLRDMMYRMGANVYHYQMMDIHAGGHALQEDLKRMMLYMRFPTFTKMVLDIAADMKALGRAPVNEVFNDPPSYEFSDELSEL